MKVAFLEVKEWEAQYLKQHLRDDECSFDIATLSPQNLALLNDVEILSPFIRSHVSAEAVEALPRLRMVATRSTGFDHIDMNACRARNILVCNVPSYGENTVAEHTFALILALSRKIPQTHARVVRGDYSLEGLTGFDIKGKTLGVIGTGKIGMHVVRSGRGFGMNVVAHDVYPNEFLADLLGFRYAGLDELLGVSDVVTLHTPYTDAMHHFMNREKFALMMRGSLFINTARGGLVDTDALLWALESGHLAGAGLDVVEGEEYIKEEIQLLQQQSIERLQEVLRTHVLFRRENVIFTLHNAFNSKEALERILDTTVANIVEFERGKPLNVVHG